MNVSMVKHFKDQMSTLRRAGVVDLLDSFEESFRRHCPEGRIDACDHHSFAIEEVQKPQHDSRLRSLTF